MFRNLTLVALILAIASVLMGTYVRLADAGLGCAEWPGCGIGPFVGEAGAAAHTWSLHFDLAPNWIPLTHRYLAMALVGLIFILAGLVFTLAERRREALRLVFETIVLVLLEAWLGTWVVRLQLLPLVVTAHLGVAFLIVATLYRLYLTVGPVHVPLGDVSRLRLVTRLALPLLLLQVMLGGWVSSHYATYSCPDFPKCLGAWWPTSDFAEAFYVWRGLEQYPWSLLSGPARVAIALAHRLGALSVFVLLSGLATAVILNPRIPHLREPAFLLLLLLLLETILGAEMVLLQLPLSVALAHTLVGVLLVLTVVKIHYRVSVPVPVPAARPEIAAAPPAVLPEQWAPPPAPLAEAPITPESRVGRLRSQLGKTRGGLTGFLATLLASRQSIDRDVLDDMEAQLLMADLGVTATREIVDHLTQNLEKHELEDMSALTGRLRDYLYEILEPVSQPLVIAEEIRPFVILVVGVNGVGKTTTIGKLARHLQTQGKSVMLAAGDTFRAAAVEQLQTWGERNQVPVIAQQTGADSASVIFDALQAAQARGVEVLIADTAGRLHTKSNLMEELAKIKRIMSRLDPAAPHEVLLVLDAGTGQNAINQARQFNEAVGLTGIVLTKLDGTAKGGVIFALAKQFGIPVRFIGIGETAEDLQEFDARRFIDALFET